MQSNAQEVDAAETICKNDDVFDDDVVSVIDINLLLKLTSFYFDTNL